MLENRTHDSTGREGVLKVEDVPKLTTGELCHVPPIPAELTSWQPFERLSTPIRWGYLGPLLHVLQLEEEEDHDNEFWGKAAAWRYGGGSCCSLKVLEDQN